MERLNVADYFKRPESLEPMELVYGVVREPPAPRYGHQSLLTHLGALLYRHVRERQLGQVCVAPVDVVLDERAGLVLQPDIIFIAAERVSIARERVFGPPDLVVEVLSTGTATRDRTVKVAWYGQYGVRECWLVDRRVRSVEIIDLASKAGARSFCGRELLESAVLPAFTIAAAEVFD
jgi:Uma2 family endonuclease